MNDNPLRRLEALGQSIWIDSIRRAMFSTGELQTLIDDDGITGVTSNPSIFEKAIGGSNDYDDAIHALIDSGLTTGQIYESLAVDDIQHAADLLRPIYDRLEGADGFVSLEVSPLLAHDTAQTIVEARRLWQEVARPNVMIKVPGTREGLPAIAQLLGEGINMNITLLFGLPRYRQVAEAYLSGLETLAASGKSLKSVASVASFFLSRIDSLLDPALEKIMETDPSKAVLARQCHGQIAIFSAKAAAQIYQELFTSERFRKLKALGARPQRLLWASTSTKNPAYDKLKYVEALIGPDTVNTLPADTLAEYRAHGQPEVRLDFLAAKAIAMLARLKELDIDLDAATRKLEVDGIQQFARAFDGLMKTLKQKLAQTAEGVHHENK